MWVCKYFVWATRDSAKISTICSVYGRESHFRGQKLVLLRFPFASEFYSNGGPVYSLNKKKFEKNAPCFHTTESTLKKHEARFLIKLFIAEIFGPPCVYD